MASAAPVIGDAAGVVLGLVDMLSPKAISTELQCMQAIVQHLENIESKLNDILGQIKALVSLLVNFFARCSGKYAWYAWLTP